LGLNDWLTEALSANGADPNVIGASLLQLYAAVSATVKQYEGTESRGQPKRHALRWVILELRSIFNRYYQGGDDERKEHGASKPLSEREANEEKFIKVALADAKIPAPRNIRQYFDDLETPAS
jgi:hypothetical protein